MEPRIQYAQTTDGVSIAFWTLGEGMPLVDPFGLPFSHIQLEWQLPELRRWYEGLARNRKLIRYDHRGTGLSERTAIDYSLEAQLLDIEAVVSRLGLDEFALLGNGDAGPATITYAARHPKRVSHLVLFCSYAAGDLEARLSPKLRTAFSLMDTDWELFTETASHVALGWEEGEQARRFAALLRECTTPEALRTALGQISGFDVTSLLPHVKSPTLVLHRRQVPAPDVDVATGLASRIPDARLALLEGASPYAAVGDIEPVLQAIDEFLGEGEVAAAAPKVGEGLQTILFTDVEGSTVLTQRLGDAKARDLLREHERIVREALKAHGGSEVKTMGDGFMASFSSATKALECAIAMQRAFDQHNESAEEPIRVRVGLNAGEPIAEDEDLFGTAVNEAARITATAKGGEILVSNVVRELAKGKDFLFADRGEANLKGFDEPVRLYEVRWREG
jgi:class 3 adenylate cyclase